MYNSVIYDTIATPFQFRSVASLQYFHDPFLFHSSFLKKRIRKENSDSDFT